MKKLFVSLMIYFSILGIAFASMSVQEWWGKTVHDIFEGKRDCIAYTICLLEGNIKIDVVKKGFIATASIEPGPWPKFVTTILGSAGESVFMVPGGWLEEDSAPTMLNGMGMILPGAGVEYAVEAIAKKGTEGFEYGIFQGEITEFWPNIVKPIVSRYNEPLEVEEDKNSPEYTPELAI